MIRFILRLFAMVILGCTCRAKFVQDDVQVLVFKKLVDGIDKVMTKLNDQQRNLAMNEESQKIILEQIKEMQAKLSVLEDLDEVIGAVHKRFNMDPVSEFKNLLTTDECQDGTHKCSENAVCTDEVIQYTCTCHLGFSGDGFTCKDIDECEQGTHKCHPNATCTDTVGSYECSCEDGRPCNPCIWPSIHLPDVGCVLPTTDCQWPSINLPDLGCITPIFEYMSWYKAKELCEESGKRLIEDFDASHIKLLSEIYLPMMKDNKQPWIGAKNSKWLTSQDALTDNLWKEGEPDGGEEVCNYLNLGNTVPLGIGDAKCSASGRALCQFRS